MSLALSSCMSNKPVSLMCLIVTYFIDLHGEMIGQLYRDSRATMGFYCVTQWFTDICSSNSFTATLQHCCSQLFGICLHLFSSPTLLYTCILWAGCILFLKARRERRETAAQNEEVIDKHWRGMAWMWDGNKLNWWTEGVGVIARKKRWLEWKIMFAWTIMSPCSASWLAKTGSFQKKTHKSAYHTRENNSRMVLP